MTDNEGELVAVWLISGAILALLTWAGLWAAYGVWAAIFGWIPGAIIGGISGLLIGLFWRALLAIVVLAGLAFWFFVLR